MTSDRTSYLPLLIVLALPFLVCLILMLVEPGINRSLLTDAIKVGAVLVVIGGALSFAVSRIYSRGS